MDQDTVKRASRVLDARERFESPLSSINIRLDAQQQTVHHDMQHLTQAKRVNGLRSSFTGNEQPLGHTSRITSPTDAVAPVEVAEFMAHQCTTEDQAQAPCSPTKAASSNEHMQQAYTPRIQNVMIAIGELEYSLQEMSTLEMRHSTPFPLSENAPRSVTPTRHLSEPSLSSSQGSTSSPSVTSTVESMSTRATTIAEQDRSSSPLEQALERLHSRIVIISKAKDLIEIDVRALVEEPTSNELARMQRAWKDVTATWSDIAKDAKTIHDELAEDKWLTLFRTVARQADDIMSSLDNVITDCENNARQLQGSTIDHDKSLRSKMRSYATAGERVVKILAKTIADRSTTNGEALRTHADAKARWDILHSRMSDIELEQTVTRTPPRPPKSPRRVSNQVSPSDTPVRDRTNARSRASSLARSVGSPEKPRWNISTKSTTDREESGRVPATLARSTPGPSGRTSALGHRRPSSRASMSLSISHGGYDRPVSPSFSDCSATSRDRPSTPSKIPMPSSARRQSMTPAAAGSTSFSTQQRALSPTPTSSRRVSTNYKPRQSLGSSLGVHGTSGRSPGPTPSIASVLGRSVTPDPPRRSTLGHRPPPVPSVPANYRSEAQTTPRSVSAGSATPRRSSLLPTPRLSFGGVGSRRKSISPVPPLPNSLCDSNRFGQQEDGSYLANSVDPLDKHVANVVNKIDLRGLIETTRCDPPFTIAQIANLELLSARYLFKSTQSTNVTDTTKPVLCKLVDRVGPKAIKGDKKVLVKVTTGWQDLDAFLNRLFTDDRLGKPCNVNGLRQPHQANDDFETF
ncbi:hypothetical protein OIO90_003124 [Microbotryomycetes sp. JL221]|nr:hypothetical protein OIO90_003124 [Microbotryomycetes sp. JL221]